MAAKERVGYVYEARNTKNQKGYVGQTIRAPEVRWAQHLRTAKGGDVRPLYRALRRDGAEAFTLNVLWQGSEKELNAAEKRYVRIRSTFIDTGWGYNLTTGGDHKKLSKASRRKISRSLRLQFASIEARTALSARRKRQFIADPTLRVRCVLRKPDYVVSKVARTKLSKAGKQRYAAASEREKTSIALMTYYSNNAPKFVEKTTKEKQSRAAKRRWRKKSEREANAARKRAEWADPLMRAKYMVAQSVKAEKLRARWADPEYKRIVSAAIARGKKRQYKERKLASA